MKEGIMRSVNPIFMPFYFLGLLKGTKSFRCFRYLQKTQYLSLNELKKIQEEKLKSLIWHAYNNVPYYHRIFKQRNLTPSDVKKVEDLEKLPIITKNDMRNDISNFVARNYQEYEPFVHSTSGSTGEPFRYNISKEAFSMGMASAWRGYSYAGYRLGDKMALLAGPSLVADTRMKINRFIISHPNERILSLPSVDLSENVMKEYSELLGKVKPKYLKGNPSALQFFAYFLREESIDDIHLEAVMTTSEKLFPFQRKLFEEVFECEVFDGYGGMDFGATAFECKEHSGYHVDVEKAVIEFLDEERGSVSPGEMGRIVATNLYNYAMPFIRYDSQDLGIPLDRICECGRELPLIKEVVGRVVDILKFDDGTVVSGWPLTLVFAQFDIKRFQIVQTDGKSLVIKLVKGRNYLKDDTQSLFSILRKYLSENIDMQIEFVEQIPLTKGGKWKYIVSK